MRKAANDNNDTIPKHNAMRQCLVDQKGIFDRSGRAAYYDGKDFDMCPWDRGTLNDELWLLGYIDGYVEDYGVEDINLLPEYLQ